MDEQEYRQLKDWINRAPNQDELERYARRILKQTGFGELGSTVGETGEVVKLDFLEIAACLTETDRTYFQRHIELLVFANQRQKRIVEAGGEIIEPEPPKPWEMFT